MFLKRQTNPQGSDLLVEFLGRLKPHLDEKRFGKLTIPHLAKKLEKIPTTDLYYLKRVSEDSKHYAKRFFWELNPVKHEPAQ